MAKIKILMLNYEYPPLGGGASVANEYLIKEFSRYSDIEIDLIASSVDKAAVVRPFSNITIHLLDIGKKNANLHYQSIRDLLAYSWKAFLYAGKIRREKRFDLIHAFFGIPCGAIAMALKMPYIVSLRGSDVPFHNPRFRWMDRILFKPLSLVVWGRARYVIANSETLVSSAEKIFGKKQIALIPNGIDTSMFYPETNKKADDRPVRLLFVGRLSEVKGVAYLLEGFAKALKDSGGKKASLSIVGDGSLSARLKTMADELGIRDSVVFYDRVERRAIAEVFRGHDVFVLPSINEGMPQSLAEAMASGLGVICTDLPLLKKLVLDGTNGYVVKPADPDAIARAIVKYIEGGIKLAMAHGVVSVKKISGYSWHGSAEQYVGFYRKMTNE